MTATELLREVLIVAMLVALGFLIVLLSLCWGRVIRRLRDHDIHGEG